MTPAERLVLVAAVAALAASTATAWLGRRVRRARGSWRARRRAARASEGEDRARALLRRAGYDILGAQVRATWSPRLDGAPAPTELRADYVVAARGRTLVAEVKTGDEAPSLATAATRRQLLEYRVAFDVDGVLLVRPEQGTIHRVDFPLEERPARGRPAPLLAALAGLAVGAAAALLAR